MEIQIVIGSDGEFSSQVVLCVGSLGLKMQGQYSYMKDLVIRTSLLVILFYRLLKPYV